MNNDFVFIFLHLPKCGGRSLTHIIKRQYFYKLNKILGNNHFYEVTSSKDNEEFKRLPANKKEKIKVLMGHMNFGLHKYFKLPSIYTSILRNPVDRVVSHYYYVLRSPNHYLYDIIKKDNMSLYEYVKNGVSTELNNGQIRLLSGVAADYGKCDENMLLIAKRNIEEYFPIVGLLEEFDKTLILLKKYFKWRYPFYTKLNVTKKRRSLGYLSNEEQEVIQEYNELDIKLYGWAQKRMEQQVKSAGDSFQKELNTFKKLNLYYSKLYTKIRL